MVKVLHTDEYMEYESLGENSLLHPWLAWSVVLGHSLLPCGISVSSLTFEAPSGSALINTSTSFSSWVFTTSQPLFCFQYMKHLYEGHLTRVLFFFCLNIWPLPSRPFSLSQTLLIILCYNGHFSLYSLISLLLLPCCFCCCCSCSKLLHICFSHPLHSKRGKERAAVPKCFVQLDLIVPCLSFILMCVGNGDCDCTVQSGIFYY